jgi:hypothetical protein
VVFCVLVVPQTHPTLYYLLKSPEMSGAGGILQWPFFAPEPIPTITLVVLVFAVIAFVISLLRECCKENDQKTKKQT